MKPHCERQASGAIELYVYGELSAEEQDQVARHIDECADCQAAVRDLAAIRRALAARPVVEGPQAGDWSGFMARLDASIAQDARIVAPDRQPAVRPFPRASTAPRWSVPSLLATAALLALTTLGVTFAMRARHPVTQAPEVSSLPAAAPSVSADDKGFEALSEEHFERSKLVVLGLAAKDAAHTSSADWTYERALAATLLTDTRMYRMAAEDRGLRSIADVMGDLELVLLQASFTDVRDPASLAQIQRLIRKRDLVEKMDVVAMSGL
jgi:Putative zinc-finger